MFGYVLLYHWACEGKEVVVRKAGYEGNAPYLYCADGVFELSEATFKQKIREPDVM